MYEKGNNVFVTQGKTEHVATILGSVRSSPDNDQMEIEIRWATAGSTAYVPLTAVRFVNQLSSSFDIAVDIDFDGKLTVIHIWNSNKLALQYNIIFFILFHFCSNNNK
jgi:uncharacterized protein YuzE